MRVVVTGSTGRLGQELVTASKRAGHEVTGLARGAAAPCDLTDRDAVARRLDADLPDLVIHAAGATDVDGCEREPHLAHLLNVTSTQHVVDAAAAVGAHVVYVSTNHIFDGRSERPYREDDEPGPVSVYGATKLAGEEAVGPTATIARTAWLWSPLGSGIVPAIVAGARRAAPLRFASDESAQPTSARDLAPVLLRLGEDRAAGVFHSVGDGAVSSYGLARSVLAALGDDPDRVEPIAGRDLPGRLAARPRNGVLDTARTVRAGAGLPHHLEAIRAFVREHRPPV